LALIATLSIKYFLDQANANAGDSRPETEDAELIIDLVKGGKHGMLGEGNNDEFGGGLTTRPQVAKQLESPPKQSLPPLPVWAQRPSSHKNPEPTSQVIIGGGVVKFSH
jgi:hypothetical protein